MRTSIEYEDKHIIVAYKPAGLATQTARIGQADMVSELKNYLHSSYLGVVHRLDQPVEGLLVFGKTREAAAALTRQLEKGTLHKRYQAVVCGKPDTTEGELVDYLYKTADNRAQIVSEEQAAATGAKRAALRYRILESRNAEVMKDTGAVLSLVDIQILTGRFHQIRAQMAHCGLPLLGDSKYGTELSGAISRELHVRNVALCACELQLQHPASRERLCFQIHPQGEIFSALSYIDNHSSKKK
jgi:23S rRNA pseudouridine1911/1915/1917 synthase